MRIAIVIPTYNSGRTLGRCLASIASNDVRPSETVVVDDVRTSDDTRAIAMYYDARLIISPAGMSESRNLGIRSTGTDLVLSLDSDMSIENGLLRATINCFQDRHIDAASIAEVSTGYGY